MLKDRIGGTSEVVANSEEACRIVPSPPKVAVKSTFSDSGTRGGVSDCGLYTGNEKEVWRELASSGSRMMEILG